MIRGACDEGRALELIQSGANPNSTWGATHRIETENRAVHLNPLHFALARAQPRVAIALLEAGADPNSRDDDGDTALIVAANKNWPAVVHALLAKGADPNATSRDGETPRWRPGGIAGYPRTRRRCRRCGTHRRSHAARSRAVEQIAITIGNRRTAQPRPSAIAPVGTTRSDCHRDPLFGFASRQDRSPCRSESEGRPCSRCL